MLITPSDFGGDYRLFNYNNLDQDIIVGIDQAQFELATDLFKRGSNFIISNNPHDPPNVGLRALNLHKLFIAWVFCRIEQGIAGAGIKKASDVAGRSRFATGAFFAIARHYSNFIAEWIKYEGFIEGNATTHNTISVQTIVSDLIAPGMILDIGGSEYNVVASGPGVLYISPHLPSLGVLRLRQISLIADKRWNYI